MLEFLLLVVGVLLVGGLLFLGGSLLLGRGETQPPAELDRSPVELPDDRPVAGDDLRALQISVAFRGYRMTEVDWLIDQLAQALDERDARLAERTAEVAALRARLGGAASPGTGPTATDPPPPGATAEAPRPAKHAAPDPAPGGQERSDA